MDNAGMTARRKISIAVVIGVVGIVACEVLLLADVRGWTHGGPGGIVRENLTPLCWLFYLVLMLGVLATMDGRSWIRRFPHRFAVCWLWSVPAWCFFDWMNFYFMRDLAPPHHRAWEYINLPELFSDRLVGYLIAFGAIAPGMFLSAELLMRMGFGRLRTRPVAIPRGVMVLVFLLGIPLAAVPFLRVGPIANLALWVGNFALLDPINLALGRPSILGDWRAGRWGRTLALGGGGLLCGFLWEFWNFWATSKWEYHLPFLGRWEQYKYFEMPVPGLVGFIAFGIETWVMWQTSLLVLGWLVEGEGRTGEDEAIREELCF